MKLRTTIAALALTVCLPALGAHQVTAQTTAAPPPPGDPARGKSDFTKYGCYECHGTLGQGNFTTAPRLAPHTLPYASLLAYIRKPSGVMPSYSAAILPEADAADIYAYLTSIAPGKTPEQLPLLAGTTLKSK
jgi:ubiquinol-cytochrome c reductase cytochrome c subunit